MEKGVSVGHRVIMSSTSSSCEIYAVNMTGTLYMWEIYALNIASLYTGMWYMG